VRRQADIHRALGCVGAVTNGGGTIISLCQSPDFTLDALKRVVP
jgi:hypothetical protein